MPSDRSFGFLHPLVALALGLLATGALGTSAQPSTGPWNLRFAVPAGLTWTFAVEVETSVAMQLTAGGQTAERNDRGRDVMRGRVTVEAVRDGRPTRAVVRFDPACGLTALAADGSRTTRPFALAGRTVRLTIDDRRIADVATADRGDDRPLPALTPVDLDTIAQLVTLDPAMVPATPVRIGDAWSGTESPSVHQPGPRVDFELRLAGHDARPTGSVLELDLNATLTSVDPNQPMRGTVRGRINLDAATGLPREANTVADLDLGGEITQNGTSIRVAGTGRSERRATFVIGPPATAGGNPLGPAGRPGRDTPRGRGDTNARPGNPLGAPATDATSEAAADDALARATRDWTTYRHTSGGSFRHPAGWTVQDTPQGLLVSPPDGRPNEELILGLAAPAPGQSDPMAAEVARDLDALIASSLPTLRRSGRPKGITAPDASIIGSRHVYTGVAPDGRSVRCEVFLKLGGGTATGFSLVGLANRVSARAETVELMFRTIRMPEASATAAGSGARTGAGARGATTASGGDARLVGRFRGETISNGDVYVNTQLVYAINADGTLLYGAQSAISTSRRDASGNPRWTADGVTDGSVKTGRWSTAGNRLTINWDAGGRSVFRYGFEPNGALVLRNPTSGKLINFFPRIR